MLNLSERLLKSEFMLTMMIHECSEHNKHLKNLLEEMKVTVKDARAYIDASNISSEIEDILRGDTNGC